MEAVKAEQPPFDDARRALEFALNAHEVQMPRPAMTTAMAEGIKKAKAKRKRSQRVKALIIQADEDDRKAAEMAAMIRAAFRRRGPSMDAKERSAQAGFILATLAKLDPIHELVLAGLLIRSHRPCHCRAPCCSGWAVNLRWAKTVADMCQALKEHADLLKVPGKRGMSTDPGLRRACVEAYFRGEDPKVNRLAKDAEISLMTAAKHRARIMDFLKEAEDKAWPEIMALLDAAGITGTFTD